MLIVFDHEFDLVITIGVSLKDVIKRECFFYFSLAIVYKTFIFLSLKNIIPQSRP